MSTILFPDGDIQKDWPTTTGTDYYTEIDEGTDTPDDDTYIETTDLDDVMIFTLTETPENTSTVTRLDVKVRGKITDTGETARYKVELYHGSSTPIGSAKYLTGTDFGAYGTLGTAAALSWTGLSLTKAQADDAKCKVTFETP